VTRELPSPRRPVLERILDGPERVLLRLPWPSTPRIILQGSLGFLRQVVRSRALTRGR
jgi:hypothetical protein